jgi:uncharacterized phage protein gp47/JayE
MYENQTFETILERMLARIDTDVDKSEGSLLYNALAPEAWELAQAYIAIDYIYDSTFADTAPREELILRGRERGLEIRKATCAVLKGVFDVDLSEGSRFSIDDLFYTAIERIESGVWKMRCESAGTVGNKKFGDMIASEYIDGLNSARLTELLVPGTEEEDTEAFRKRYFESFESQSFGGNIADYISKTESIVGVGGAKYYRVTSENNRIKLQIINSEYGVPSSDLVNIVQTTLDPSKNHGEGLGLAPIGHIVDVEGCVSTSINISATFSLNEGLTWPSVSNNVDRIIDKYLLELAASWSDNDRLVVRISQIESRLLGIDGIVDIADTAINGVKANLILEANAIPVRGNINAT